MASNVTLGGIVLTGVLALAIKAAVLIFTSFVAGYAATAGVLYRLGDAATTLIERLPLE